MKVSIAPPACSVNSSQLCFEAGYGSEELKPTAKQMVETLA